MPTKKTQYSPEYKKTLVTLYQSGKTYAQIKNEYGVSSSTLSAWIHQFSEVKIDDETILTAKQIKELQKRNAQLEEENLILKKAIAIFTPHSSKEYRPFKGWRANTKSLYCVGCCGSIAAPTTSKYAVF